MAGFVKTEDEEGVQMESMPDEILLFILGGLEDGDTLMDVVPVVCKRWRRLARDPRAWAGVAVLAPLCDHVARPEDALHHHARMAAATRLLACAPALRSLTVNLVQPPQPCQDAFLNAVADGRAVVRELRLVQTGVSTQWRPPTSPRMLPLLKLLRRSGDHVRLLELHNVQASDKWWKKLWDAVARLTALERLELRACGRLAPAPYAAQLATYGCLPRLRCLVATLTHWPAEDGDDAAQGALLTDIVRTSADSLRVLDVVKVSCRDTPGRVVADNTALSACLALRSVALPLHNAPGLRGLPNLRSLRLRLHPDCRLPKARSALATCSDTLRRCRSLDALRDLDLDVEVATSAFDAEADSVLFQRAFAGLGVLCSNATTLTLTLSPFVALLQGVAEELLLPLARLESALIFRLPAAALAALCGAARLRDLSGIVLCDKKGASCAKCWDALRDFQNDRPEVRTAELCSH